jgi:alpha-1,2-mannosyltransferase
VAYPTAPEQSARYWLHLVADSSRIGPMGSVINQSLRGTLARSTGHEVGGLPWLAAVLVAAALLGYALRGSLRAGDTLAGIMSVQVFGLLAAPISWSHHWVWVVPTLLWLAYGPARATPWTRLTAALWLLITGSFLISYLLRAQSSIWYIPRPWYLAALGWAYPACGLLTLLAIGVSLRHRSREPSPAGTWRTGGGNNGVNSW